MAAAATFGRTPVSARLITTTQKANHVLSPSPLSILPRTISTERSFAENAIFPSSMIAGAISDQRAATSNPGTISRINPMMTPSE